MSLQFKQGKKKSVTFLKTNSLNNRKENMSKSKEQQLKEIEALLNIHNHSVIDDKFVKEEEE